MEEMEWINAKDRLPKPFEVVWIYWRDREVLLGCKIIFENDDDVHPYEQWYSFEDVKCKWAYWWMPVNRYTYDKPAPPKESANQFLSKRERCITAGGDGELD